MAEIAIEKDIMVLTTKTVEVLLAENPDALALYLFYYKTAKRQETNQPFASKTFCKKGLGWGSARFQKAKDTLEKHGLTTQIKRIDEKTKRVKGWYVRLNYLWKEETQRAHFQRVAFPEGGKRDTNALSSISKMLKVEEETTEASSEKVSKPKLKDPQRVQKLIDFSVKRRGGDFADCNKGYCKQKKAFLEAQELGITIEQMREKWLSYEKDKFWKEKDFDWMNVFKGFNKIIKK